MFLYVCGLCKTRMFPPRGDGCTDHFQSSEICPLPPPTPHEQNVPGRAQPFRKTLMCFDSSAEKRSCGFQQCSPKITEKTNTNGGLIAASQRALADVFMCCRDNFEQESSARSGMSLSPCRRRKTERCSHVSHSSAH